MLPMVQTEPLLYNCGGRADSDAATASSATLSPSVTPDSHADELADIFFDVDVAVHAYSRSESCELHLGDTWRGMQDTMSVTTPVKKNRKKSDSKPLSQINKCHNEKRRRELENETINQLEELLTSCLAEVKQPDKNGIVREATQQIQQVLRRRLQCPGECPLRSRGSGELVPSRAGAANQALHYSELTSLIEALKHYTSTFGWVLLELNAKGEIVCITENIKELIQQERTELHTKSIFSILHSNDHAKLRPLLRSVQTFSWGSGEIDKFQAIKARLLINNSHGTDADSSFVEGVIHAAPVRGSSSEEAGSVMCVIRRCEDASAALSPVGPPPAITAAAVAAAAAAATATAAAHVAPDNIVFRLDCNFTVLTCDLSGVENYIDFPVSLVGARYLDLVESSDRIRIAAHLQEASCFPAPPAVSDPFRLRVAPDKPPVRVCARSRLFRTQSSTGEPDFIMSTHTVLGEEEPDMMESPRPPIGGPLLPSSVNGESSSGEPSSYRSLSPAEPQFSINDFDLEQWASPFQIAEMEDTKDRKDAIVAGEGASRSMGGGPEPPAEEPNRLRSLLSKKPAGDATNSNNILKDLLKQEDEEPAPGEHSAPHTPHTPLTPLTPAAALSPLHSQPHPHQRPHVSPHPSHPSPLPSHPSPHPSHSSPHPSHGSHPHTPHTSHQQPHHNNSDVLLRILNEKTDDENEERSRGAGSAGPSPGQPSALLSQLLLSPNGPATARHEHDAYLERMAANALKRRLDDSKGPAPPLKRATPDNQQVSSSAAPVVSSASSTAASPSTSGAGMSPLCQKNQILVSLLARQQTAPPPPAAPALRPFPAPRPAPPPHPLAPRHPHAALHPQHPQQRHNSALSNMLTQHNRGHVNGGLEPGGGGGGAGGGAGGGGGGPASHLQMVLQGSRAAYPPGAPPSAAALHYGNTAPPPHHAYNNHHHPPSGSARPQAGSGEQEAPSDQTLSDILDEVIENMPDADRPAPDVSVLCDLEPRQLRPDYAVMKEKNAMINAIRQSLMQCETVTKSPVSSPGTPPVYPVQSPSGAGCGMSGGLVYRVSGAGPSEGERARGLAAEQQRGLAAEQQRGLAAEQQRGLAAEQQRGLAEQQRARLLQMQRSQQMLVSPEAAEQPRQDLGSTINALVSATPPNVALTRTDYHHLYHPSNQMGSNYGTNKMPSNQQNPMLSRQLSGSGAGGYTHGAGAAAALHTPMAQQPYHRAPRPQLVGGYYEEASGYCGEYGRRGAPLHPHPSPQEHHMPCTGNGGVSGVNAGASATSEYVRNELRAVVGARSRPELHPQLQPDLDPLITFDMPTPGGASVAGSGTGSQRAGAGPWEQSTRAATPPHPAPQHNPSTTEADSAAAAAAAGGDETRPAGGAASRASLLQKLLSQ